MHTLKESVASFRRLVESGHTLEAIERFYAADVVVFENRRRARTSKAMCLEYEKNALDAAPAPPTIRVVATAVDETHQVAFLQYDIRFVNDEGRPMHLEEVAVQRWASGRIVEERFYYEGFVDEGD